jgi:serine/threonine-protein kinase HipA
MAKNNIITVFCFGQEIGRLGFDENQQKSSFQYKPEFLQSDRFHNLFPSTGILKRRPQVQVFSQYNSETFRGLPPMIADSLPDVFGNIIFKKWMELGSKEFNQISVIEQLAYVADRGMGALEYRPSRELPPSTSIDLTEIIAVLNEVIQAKDEQHESILNHEALLNIFKIGSSAGGARPKILISEHKTTGEIIPGDLNHSSEYNHYLIKLNLDDELGYSREVIEYCYYLTAKHLGITMMPSKLFEQKHFATLRFDRQEGKKKHVLTATGLTGWDYQSPKDSSYENLFELALFLKVSYRDMEELFKRMVFNVVFFNADDHLKNHSFIYDEDQDKWNISPAYDITYSLNPLMNYTRTSRALSINGLRVDITLEDVLTIAETFTIKNPKKVIQEIQDAIAFWNDQANELSLPSTIVQGIQRDFVRLLS